MQKQYNYYEGNLGTIEECRFILKKASRPAFAQYLIWCPGVMDVGSHWTWTVLSVNHPQFRDADNPIFKGVNYVLRYDKLPKDSCPDPRDEMSRLIRTPTRLLVNIYTQPDDVGYNVKSVAKNLAWLISKRMVEGYIPLLPYLTPASQRVTRGLIQSLSPTLDMEVLFLEPWEKTGGKAGGSSE